MSATNSPAYYVSRIVKIAAIKWDGSDETYAALQKFGGDAIGERHNCGAFIIATLEGNMTASVGDYIVKGLEGEFYPVKPSIFEKKYQPYP